jgi:hypothetical protein
MIYYLATNEIDVFHYGLMEEGMEFTTGQPKSFFYNTKEELINTLALYNQEYQDLNLPLNPPNIEPSLPE